MTAAGHALRSWGRHVVRTVGEADPAAGPIDAVRAVVLAVSDAAPGRPWDPSTDGTGDWVDARARAADLPVPPGGWADPWLVGVVHEQAVGTDSRSARGAWYTPRSVVRGLVALATPDGAPFEAIDRACGGGSFLLAALDRLVESGVDPEAALARVSGTDLDPGAVRTSRWSVALWAALHGLPIDPESVPVEAGDALAPEPWDHSAVGERLVIGNPPFATPLRSGRLPTAAAAVREANRDLLGPYCDLAAIHLLAAVRAAEPGTTVALVAPQSMLSGRDTREFRRFCDRDAPLQALWATREAVFDAGVRACGVVLRVGGSAPPSVALAAGPSVEPVVRADPEPPADGSWGVHAARALGAPALPDPMAQLVGAPVPEGRGSEAGPGRIGDLATATAGFRDEYYGLVDACREWDGAEGEEPNRLVTVGSVDPLSQGWGATPSRLGGRRWCRPVVDLDSLDDRIRRWVEQRLAPKVVLATQSRVLEPVVDRHGRLVPVTPLISVAADPADLDRLAAVLLAPPVVAWAWQRWFGAALSVDALKLAARQVLELPLPGDRQAWDEAATLVGRADGVTSAEAAAIAAEAAALMNRAYGAGDEVLAWWAGRAGVAG